jgi:1-pyrroline-5-carboxylate dehydrogenase
VSCYGRPFDFDSRILNSPNCVVLRKKAGAALSDPEVADFFAKAIMACVPKSYPQALAEVQVTGKFLNNFGGDNVRRLAKSFGVAGDYYGQMTVGHRWPYVSS